MVEAGQKQWYIVHTYSGFEERVKENLTQRIDALGMREKFGEVKITQIGAADGAFGSIAQAIASVIELAKQA